MVVVFQVAVDAETRPKRRREQSATRSCPDKSERRQRELHGARSRTFINHYVDSVVFHSRVKIFLDNRTQAVNFVDEQHIVLIERGEQSGEVTRLVENRT